VLALAVIVDGVTRHGLAAALRHVVPSGAAWPALLLLAAVAAVLANLVNNLPATLALIPLVAGNPAAVLAVLLGVNIGPNATYAGSLAKACCGGACCLIANVRGRGSSTCSAR